MIDFCNLYYLKQGNKRQKQAYAVIMKYRVMDHLQEYDPILVGTIPIEVDINSSDLDIICYYSDVSVFKRAVEQVFKAIATDFSIREKQNDQGTYIVSNFTLDELPVEIFGQSIPTKEQRAYLHMLSEYKILQRKGPGFRQEVIELKRQGLKTEPAFGKLLGMKDPYQDLLKYSL